MLTATKALTQDIHLKAPFTFPDGTPDGTFLVRFSVFNAIDLQGDVVLPGAIVHGQGTTLVWSHDWDTWIGDGVTETDQTGANLRGAFWLDTWDGAEAYKKVKHQGDRAEYSFGFRVTDAEFGEFDGQPVRFVKAVELFEVSPVLVGANRATHTVAIKSADSPPPHERFAEQLDRVLDELLEVKRRAEAVAALRAKAGRPQMSEARRRRLIALRDELDALLAETEPKRDEDDADEEVGKAAPSVEVAAVDVATLHARFLAFEFRQFEYEHARMGRE